MPLVEQELPTLPEHQSSSPVFNGVRVSLVFCVVFCISLFVLFLLAIVLSVLIRFTDSDYTFGIFKLVLTNVYRTLQICYVVISYQCHRSHVVIVW